MSVTDHDVPAVPASEAADDAAMKDWAEYLVAQARAEGVELSGPYRKAFTDTLAHAKQIADPFHVVKLAAGDPRGEVRDAWHAKETVPMIYRIRDHALAAETLDELSRDLRDEAFPPSPTSSGALRAPGGTRSRTGIAHA